MDSYHLPVLAVVEAMMWSLDVVGIQSHLPSLPGVSKDACLAQLLLGQGQVHSCTITAKIGATLLLQQQEALSALERCGDLDWSVFPLPATTSKKDTQPNLGSSGQLLSNIPSLRDGQPLSNIPSLRSKELTIETLNSLSHPYRRVMMLIDGKRPIEEIARLASKTPQEVVTMLKTLEHLIHF